MANLRHPYDIALENLAFIRLDLISDFMEDNGCICESEANVLAEFDQAVGSMRQARNIDKAVDLFMKQGGRPTKYTMERFEEAGVRIEPLDAA